MKSLDSIVVRAMKTITRSEDLLGRGCKKLQVGHSPIWCSSFTSTCFNYISTMSLPATFSTIVLQWQLTRDQQHSPVIIPQRTSRNVDVLDLLGKLVDDEKLVSTVD